MSASELERCVCCFDVFTVYYAKGKPYATSIPAKQIVGGLWVCDKCFPEKHLGQEANAKKLYETIKKCETY